MPDTSRARIAIRPAIVDEAPALSDLALRAKAVWGYDAAFLERCRGPLTVAAKTIAEGRVLVAGGGDGDRFGFYAFEIDGEDFDLAMLFVDPSAQRRGIGQALMVDALARARRLDCRRVTILSDPGAVAFYAANGAVRAGAAPSDAIPGRLLPLLTIPLRGAAA